MYLWWSKEVKIHSVNYKNNSNINDAACIDVFGWGASDEKLDFYNITIENSSS